jgi:hypothetical protein
LLEQIAKQINPSDATTALVPAGSFTFRSARCAQSEEEPARQNQLDGEQTNKEERMNLMIEKK